MNTKFITSESCVRYVKEIKSANFLIKNSMREKSAGWDILYVFCQEQGFKLFKNSKYLPLEQLIHWLTEKINH